MQTKKIIILGVTGSIGDSTLKVLRKYSGLFDLVGISFHDNINKASEICSEFGVKYSYCSKLGNDYIISNTKNCASYDELLNNDYDIVLIAIVGSAGVIPAHIASTQGKKILLANKESLVMAGELIINLVKKHNTTLLPVDSEHNSIFRLISAVKDYNKISITASGGSLRNHNILNLQNVSIEDVLNHPTWSMGAKITVDSATMVNKALEIIEAHYLFSKDFSELNAVIHPESFVHAILKHNDGSLFFHVYKPDMVYSIAYCMFYPEPPPEIISPVSEADLPSMNFHELDACRYPAYYLGIESGKKSGVYPAVFNASNEEAVKLFLNGTIKYTQISECIEKALEKCPEDNFNTNLDGLFLADQWARDFAKNLTLQV
jgi:1-deoxy-D-xylulose-5-phosphate reductoisomerase